MKKEGISKKILIFLFIFLNLIVVFDLTFSQMDSTGKAITTNIDDGSVSNIETIKRTYEVSSNLLNSGYNFPILGNSLINFYLKNGNRYQLIVKEITQEKIIFSFLDNEKVIVFLNSTKPIDLNLDNNYDIVIAFTSKNDNEAQIFVKDYFNLHDREISGDYNELFDIDMNLQEDHLVEARDLIVYTKFINFGEGPSKINIVYSIKNANNTEVYNGFDEKVIYTEENVIKNFDFLDLPSGDYKVSVNIFYGKNQTAFAEKDFTIYGRKYSRVSLAIASIFAIFVILFSILYFYKKNYEKN